MKTDNLLGPFIGHVTDSSVKLWLHAPSLAPGETLSLIVTLHEGKPDADSAKQGTLLISYDDLKVGTVTLDALTPETTYFYRLHVQADGDAAATGALQRVDLRGLAETDLFFRTLPPSGYKDQLDFLLMSCHNPGTATDDGLAGFGVWAQIPEIISQNKNVRFAILAGDQAYGDEVETQVLNEPDERRRQELYLGVYQKFWDNIHYRKVLCQLPAVSMWDDHDVTDGWGSREDSFADGTSKTFKPEWRKLFEAARSVFRQMQATRNPDPLSPGYKDGFDFCFKVGRAGFVVADLRSNRNVREGRVWLPAQLENIRRWVDENRADFDTLFFVSSVVFSHGAPQIERSILKYWFHVLDFMQWLGKFARQKKLAQKFEHAVGDLRDDINDSWGSDVNRAEADRVLDFLFGLQNAPEGSPQLNVVILSGDIHTPGYSTLYSADEKHQRRAAIPHIVGTPVAYQPFSWVGEAVFRHLTRVVELGAKKMYTAQVSHHFCYRNVVVISLRNYEQDESHLKVKYYLEGFPEPQVMLFDLNHGSRREAIKWPEHARKNADAPDLPSAIT